MQNIATDNGLLKIFSVYHREAYVPNGGYIIPMQAGSALSTVDLGFAADNDGENISSLNPSFCELTVLYNTWKNNKFLPATYWGLSHYRRYFTTDIHWTRVKKKDIYFLPAVQKNYDKVFSIKLEQYFRNNLEPNTVILARPIPLRIEGSKTAISMKEHYCRDHDAAGWEAMEKAVDILYPDYNKSLNETANSHELCCFNMMLAHHSVWNNYLKWLFDISFYIAANYTPPPDAYQKRAVAFLAERLMNVYFHHHRMEYKRKYMPVVFFIAQ